MWAALQVREMKQRFLKWLVEYQRNMRGFNDIDSLFTGDQGRLFSAGSDIWNASEVEVVKDRRLLTSEDMTKGEWLLLSIFPFQNDGHIMPLMVNQF